MRCYMGRYRKGGSIGTISIACVLGWKYVSVANFMKVLENCEV